MKPVEHGTSRGYRMELARQMLPCLACLRAACEDTKARLREGRCKEGLGWPLGPGDPAPRPRKRRI